MLRESSESDTQPNAQNIPQRMSEMFTLGNYATECETCAAKATEQFRFCRVRPLRTNSHFTSVLVSVYIRGTYIFQILIPQRLVCFKNLLYLQKKTVFDIKFME